MQDLISTEKKLSMVVYACHPSYGEKHIGGMQCRPVWAKGPRLFFRITRVKRARGMAQVVEHLPSIHEVMSSNPSTTKN
jgi:hypothetical protein